MGISGKEQSVIQQVESCKDIAGRFTKPTCINASVTGKRQGCFSLVFKAYDVAEGNDVILKFLSPESMGDKYRVDSFSRESDILKLINSNKRCIELVYGPDTFNWQVNVISGVSLDFDLNYFVTEFLPEEIEPFFLKQTNYQALTKLKLFRSIVLAISAIHNSDISHRDIKPDNFRGIYVDSGEILVKVIDYGTAAHYSSPLVTTDTKYPTMSVGARAFSAPEQLVGMASKREIGKLTDIYALGTLLYQLFNLQIFAYPRSTAEFDKIINYLHMAMGSKKMEQKEEIWANVVPKFRHQLEPPRIDDAGHSLPPSLVPLLSELVRSMTVFDYRERIDNLDFVLKRIDSAISVLENIQLDRKLAMRRELKRKRRIEKLAYQKQKLEEYLAKRERLLT